MILVADDAPTHTGHAVRDFLNTHSIKTIKWSAQCPDFNPKENVWRMRKDEVECLNDLGKNDTNELINHIKRAWSRIRRTRMETLRKIYKGMQQRLQMVIAAERAQTKW